MSDPMRDAMAKALTENGISEGVDGLHGWRCAYPDCYGPCTCFAELLDDLAAALAPLIEARVREAQADAWDEGYAKGFYRAQTIHNDDPDRERDASEFDDPNPFYEEVRRNA